MTERFNESVNIAIMENEMSAEDWSLVDLARDLYWWVDFINIAFFKDQPVPVPAISFAKTKITSFGHYVAGRNAFGIKENININRAHLYRPLWSILATLLHEMTHSWQAIYGKSSKSWFHNKEFRMKLKKFGIVCNEKGRHAQARDPFVFLLKKHGVSFENLKNSGRIIETQATERAQGQSKLKKWECACGQKARVGRKEFFATCDLCGKSFVLVS